MATFSLLISVFMTLLSLSIAETVSMDTVSGFTDLRECGDSCFGWQAIKLPLDRLADVLSCDGEATIENECFCRADLQDMGVKHLQTCVSSSCSGNTIDIAAATQFYKDYCTSAGYTAAPKSVKAQTTQTTGGTTLSTATSVTAGTTEGDNGTPIETEKPSSSNAPPSSKGSSTKVGEIVGIVAGVVAALAAVAGAFFGYKRYKQLKKARQQRHLEEMDKSGIRG